MADKASKQAYDPATYRTHTRHGVTTGVFSSNNPHRAPLLCYIAGIECPITDATVSYGVWKIPEAQITLFPDPQMQRFGAEDRVPVALFYLDEYIDATKPTWRLLFEGEITGWSYMNAAGSRALSFSCVMNMAMWTQLFLFYMTSLSSIAQGVVAAGRSPANTAQAQAVPGFSLFRQGLLIPKDKTAGSPDDYIKRPYDLAYNVVRSLISSSVPEKQRCIPGINFFARWSRREQFHNRWVALPFLEEPTTVREGKEVVEKGVPGIFPILRAAQSLQAVRAVESYVADRYSGGSIYTILKQVLDTVMMELAMLPTAPCVATRTDGVIKGQPVFRTAAQKSNVQAQENIAEAKKILKAQKDLFKTQSDAKGKAKQSAVDASKAAKKKQTEPSKDDSAELYRALSTAGVSLSGLISEITEADVDQALKNLDKKDAATKDTGPKDAKLPTRLANYFIKPQMLFGLPPNCNVIFPSMTPQISYQENYVTQPTRLYFQDDSLMQLQGFATQDPATQQVVLAALSRAYPPEADVKWQAHLKTDAAKSGKNLLIWPEEFFKGPVTARYPAPPWLMFLASQYQVEGHKAGSKTGTPTQKSTKADATKANDRDGGALTDQDVYALYAQYEYFRHRFAQRNGAVTCAFHPYLVPGFPVAVLDDFQSRMHVIGYLMNVTQQFAGRSVSTSANFGYGRTLYEFLDLLANELDTGGAVADRKNLAMAAAPAEPIKEIRDVIQHFYKAEQFYQTLLHKRTSVAAVFEYRRLLAFIDGKGALEDITIEGINEETIANNKEELSDAKKVLEAYFQNKVGTNEVTKAKTATEQTNATETAAAKARKGATGQATPADETALRKAIAAAGLTLTGFESVTDKVVKAALENTETQLKALNNPKVKHNLADTLAKELAPKPGAEPYFDSYDAAMRYAARPICTLDEYVEFIRGVKEGSNDEFAYEDGTEIPSARFYTQVRPRPFTPKTTPLSRNYERNGKRLFWRIAGMSTLPLRFNDERCRPICRSAPQAGRPGSQGQGP
jgi:hypothetical protein